MTAMIAFTVNLPLDRDNNHNNDDNDNASNFPFA